MIKITALASSSKGNCYHITDGSTPILIESGIPFKDIQKKLNFQTHSIAACLLSHEHQDHSKSAKDILKAGINIYTSKGTAEALNLKHHRVKTIKAKKSFRLGTWIVMPFDVKHDAAEPLGFLLANKDGEKLVFITDSYYSPYKFNGLTHIMIECNYSMEILNENIANGKVPRIMKKRLLKSHFSLENVKDFLRINDLSRVQEIWLLHLSDNNSNEELFKSEIQKLTGKVVYVPR